MTTALPMQFKVGLVQMSMSDDPEANLGKAVARIREAAEQGATLVCLPELFRTRYIGQREDHALFDLAEAVPGPTTETLGKIAKENSVVVIASLFERRAAGLYHNTAAVIDADGKVKGIYRKMHIPDDPSYYEKFYFTPGDLGFRVIGPFDEHVRSDRPDEFDRRRVSERRHIIHRLQARQHDRAGVQGIHWPPRPLEVADALVGIQADDQQVGLPAGLLQVLHVPGV